MLVKCDTETLRGLREDLDVVLVEFSVEELPNLKSANMSIFIFLSVVLSAAFGLGADCYIVFLWRIGDGC